MTPLVAMALVLGSVPWPWTGSGGEVGQCLVSDGTSVSWGDCGGGAASDLACTACVTDSEIADVAGSKVTGAVATATALAANPADCGANTFATTIAANGNLTCAAIADSDVPDGITVTLAATATALAANPADCAANQFATTIAANGNLTCAALTDADIPNNITVDLAATATALASNPTDCAGGQFANAIDASGNLTCAAPAAGGFPTGKLSAPVAVAVNASYVQVFSVTPGASLSHLLSFRILHTASATTVGVQFRVSSADTGNVGNCIFQAKGIAGTAASATAEEYDTIAIAAAPADNAAAAASSTALNIVEIDCQFVSDGSPGALLLEAQLETGTTSINILPGSYYTLVSS